MDGNIFKRELGVTIGKLRVAAGKSQQDVADELQVKRETIKQWENGQRYIKAGDIVRLANYFNVSADVLLGREDSTSRPSVGLTKSAWDVIDDLDDAQRLSLQMILLSPFFHDLLAAVERCALAYQKQYALVNRAEAAFSDEESLNMISGMDMGSRVKLIIQNETYRQMCGMLMASAEDEANLAIMNVQRIAGRLGERIVHSSKTAAGRKNQGLDIEAGVKLLEEIQNNGKEAVPDGKPD